MELAALDQILEGKGKEPFDVKDSKTLTKPIEAHFVTP